MARGFVLAGMLAMAAYAAALANVADVAKAGDWVKVRSLLTAGGNARSVQADGMTALHWAVQANEGKAVAALLKAGADPNAANRYGITPLWLAATNGSAEMTRVLLKAKANPAAKLPHGETALMAAARTGDPETVKLLIEAGADPDAQETSQGETALMWAAAENQGEAIRALIAGGAKPNLHAKALALAPMDWMQVGMVSTVLPRGGFTAAMYAARQDAQDAMRALADGKADLDAQDPDGATAIQFAIINQHFDMAALLLEKGASPNVADNTGMTSLYAAVDMIGFRSEIGRPAKALPDKLNALDVVRLALANKADPNAQLKKAILGRHHGFGDNSLGEGATALMRAAKSNDVEAMEVLLQAGADASHKAKNGSTALLNAAGARVGPGGTAKVVASLQLLARQGADLNAANNRGQRALHVAATQGSNAIVKALAELGADLNATDKDGKTALDLVMQPGRNRHEDTEVILKELAAQRASH